MKIARWNHICFRTQGSNRGFYHNEALASVKANAGQLNIPGNAMSSLGIEGYFEESFSGLVADVQFFPRALSVLEMKKLGKLETVADSVPIGNYANGLTNTTVYESDFTFPYSTRDDYNEYPIAFSLEACRLLNDRDEHVITFPKKNVKCKKAKEICLTFGGTLPKLQFGNQVDIAAISSELKVSWVSDSMAKDAPCQKATRSSGEDTKFVVKPGNEAATSFMCIVPKDTVFKFKQSQELIYDFLLIDPKEFKFESPKENLELTVDSEYGASVRSTLYYEEVFSTETIKDPLSLMGRKEWNHYDSDDMYSWEPEPTLVLFSVCNDNEFSCSTGICIPLTAICNFEKNCPDGSDEEYCDAARIPEGFYDLRLSPAESKNDITPLSMKITLDRVIKLDMEDNIMSLSLTVIVTWRDPRLNFKNLLANGEPTLVNKTVAKSFWHPRLLLPTAATDSKETFYLDSKQGRVDAMATKDGLREMIGGYECKFYIVFKSFLLKRLQY